MSIQNLNDKDKEALVELVLELHQKLIKKKASVKKYHGDLEAARRSNQNLKNKISYLRSRIVEHHSEN